MNKKGLGLFQIFSFLFLAFFVAIFLGIYLWVFTLMDESLDLDIDVGNVNLQDINNQTFGKIVEEFKGAADNMGMALILGMALLMILNGYYFGPKSKLWFSVDIVILVFAFILAVYLSSTYSTFINSSSLLEEVYITDLAKTSSFVLQLPIYVSTLGFLIMIVTYAGIRKRKEEVPNVLGY